MRMLELSDTNGYNDHYGTRHHKYTINLPLEMMRQAQIKSKEAGFNEVAPYFRAILSREIQCGSLVLSDILGQKEVKRMDIELKIRREKEEVKEVKISSKNFLAKVRNIMYAFNRSKDQQRFEF